MRGKKSKEVYNYTSIQVYKVYSIHYTVYSVHGYSIQCTGYKGIRVYSIKGIRVTVYRVQREVGRGYIMSRIWHAGHRPCEFVYFVIWSCVGGTFDFLCCYSMSYGST